MGGDLPELPVFTESGSRVKVVLVLVYLTPTYSVNVCGCGDMWKGKMSKGILDFVIILILNYMVLRTLWLKCFGVTWGLGVLEVGIASLPVTVNAFFLCCK